MTKITLTTALNTPTAAARIPAGVVGDSTAYYVPLGKFFYPTITEAVTMSRTDLGTSVSLTVTGTTVSTLAAPAPQLLVKNTGDTVGGSDYQNEAHIRLQAGTTTDHRKWKETQTQSQR